MKFLSSILFIGAFTGCTFDKPSEKEDHTFVSYLDIKIDSLGRPPEVPYTVDLQKNKKRLIVVGTLHSMNPDNPMFTKIEEIFNELNPEITINEGGQVSKTFIDRDTAISSDGETGLLKFLCDKKGIKMLNGDMPESDEFYELSKEFSQEEALLFFASERFVLPYKYFNQTGNFDSLYENDFMKGYMEVNGIKLAPKEKTFSHYKMLYQKFFQLEFSMENIQPDNFSPIRKTHPFCEIARASKKTRDRYLAQQIESQLKQHDKVLVVFGAWHVLAIEPTLRQIINREDK